MSNATGTITEFLLARIAEDEAAADRAMPSGGDDSWTSWACEEFWHVAIGEDRMRAECEAKRRIVELLENALAIRSTAQSDERQRWVGDLHLNALGLAAQALASVYADHPDYRNEWAA